MRALIATVAAMALVGDASAAGRLFGRRGGHTAQTVPMRGSRTPPAPVTPPGAEGDALAEVNEARRLEGLPPFRLDPALAAAAMDCARFRAARGITGHVGGPMSDHAFCRYGSMAASCGAGGMEPAWGWRTCCTYEGYTYAGAAWVTGAGGVRYMSLFVK